MKKLAIAVIAFASASALASNQPQQKAPSLMDEAINHAKGVYASVETGYVDMGYGKKWVYKHVKVDPKITYQKSPEKRGFLAKAVLGYCLGKNLAVEASYARLPTVKFRHLEYMGNDFDVKLKSTATELLGKYTYAINDKFDLMGKAGAVLIHRPKVDHGTNASRNKVLPAGVLGMEYSLMDHVKVSAAYERYFGMQEMPTMNMGTMSISYTLS